jgi:three-Cys-motif partner protein
MPKQEIDDKPFSESTLTKLDLFERYAREWLPVFLGMHIRYPDIHVCDFFSGSGTDIQGNWGSALRLLRVIREYRGLIANKPVKVRVYLSDKSKEKITRLREHIVAEKFDGLPAEIDLEALAFEERFAQLQTRLASPGAANLLIVDQYGVKHLDSTFDAIVQCPTTDFLAFVSSSWFQRFHSLPEVARYLVDHRPEAYHLAHRVALDAYRKRLPQNRKYYLGEFSLKSGSNIYGVVFGSAHPLGMAKFLKSAWQLDGTNGSANFDVEREGIFGNENQQFLFGGTPKKVEVFEEKLERAIRNKSCRDEMDVLEHCFQHGVTPQHATPTLKKLKKEGIHQASWWVPDPKNHRNPRPLQLS